MGYINVSIICLIFTDIVYSDPCPFAQHTLSAWWEGDSMKTFFFARDLIATIVILFYSSRSVEKNQVSLWGIWWDSQQGTELVVIIKTGPQYKTMKIEPTRVGVFTLDVKGFGFLNP